MRYTAIALDYDGPIAHDGVVPPHVLEGLARLKATGRKLLLVTGRELDELLGIFPGITLFDRVVAENGALLYRPENGERKDLGEAPPEAFIERLIAEGVPLSVGNTIVATVRPHETAVLQAIADLGLEYQVIFNKGAVMVLPPGCNKASGLKAALAEIGLSPRNVVASGDGENDHALFELSEYSAAVANAVPKLQEAADYVTRAHHGDGVLEIVTGLIEHDLAQMPPRKPRRTLNHGKDEAGADVVLPRRRASILATGAPEDTHEFCIAVLERLCKKGYQVCVIDTRGAFTDFKPAVVFGTPDNPPAVDEVVTALVQPDVQAVASLTAVPETERRAFVQKLIVRLSGLRDRTGRPHWILLDEASALLPASAQEEDSTHIAAENTIYVTADPTALAPAILAAVHGIVACGTEAGAMIDAFAAAVSWGKPALPARAPNAHEALVWFRKSERPVALVNVARVKADPPAKAKAAQATEKSPEVGRVLRRA
jgi:hydroxymethylpyrimidine pyrophosphatase-like HAD family hydrolase